VGLGKGGNIPIDTTICLEFTPQNRRFSLAPLSVFQQIGAVVCSAIEYSFIPKWSCKPDFLTADPLPSCRNVAHGVACSSKSQDMGHRYLLYTLRAITLSVFFVRFVVFRFQDSPKFLLYVRTRVRSSPGSVGESLLGLLTPLKRLMTPRTLSAIHFSYR
jgi:hypothetical protein